jgi:hypothetical protein
MRPLRLKCPIDSEPLEAFLFFVQALDEQLYDFTDDSYKAPALNTFTRTLELQSLANLNHLTGRGQDALVPFVEELEWSVRRDPVLSPQLRAICQIQVKSVRETLGQPNRVARSLAGMRIALGDYFQSIQDAVARCILDTPKHKEDIAQLAANFVVQAEVAGFPRRHTYHTLQNQVLRRLPQLKAIDHAALLTKFFDNFKINQAEYYCIFIADAGVKLFAKLLQTYEMEVLTEPPAITILTPQQSEFLGTKNETQVYLKLNKMRAESPVAIHEMGTRLFAEFMSAVRYVEHRLDYSLSGLSLVVRQTDSKCFMVRDSPDPMHCWSASHSAGELEMLELVEVLHGPHLLEESAYRLRRAVRYHGAALRSGSPENQLVDLWAALEGLLSQPPHGGKRIDFFAESLIPPLTLTYPEKILRSLYAKATRVSKVSTLLESAGLSGTSSFSKFVHLLLCAEYEEQRKTLFSALSESPLLKNRAFRVAMSLNNRAATLETLKNHREKVRWHVDRIYATRNSIMHNASALPYLPTLVENLHVYNDALVNSIVRVAISAEESVSIESVLQYIASWEKYRIQSLSESAASIAKSQVTIEDAWTVVFGSQLALAPTR